jgi:hypothetical protein
VVSGRQSWGVPTEAVPAGEDVTIEAASFEISSRNTFAKNIVKRNPEAALVWTLSAVHVTLHAFSAELDSIARKGGPRPRVIEPQPDYELSFSV